MTDQPRLNPVTIDVLNKPTEERFAFDFNRVKRDEIETFVQEIQVGQTLDKWIARIIVRWPFAGNPNDASLYGHMGMVDFAELKAAFEQALFRLPGTLVTKASSPNGGETLGGRGEAGAVAPTD